MPQRSYHHGDLRKALLAAATRELERVGYERLSLRDLAAAQAVSSGAPYRHFPDRRTLLAALATEAFKTMWNRLRAAARPAAPGAKRVRAMARAYLDFARAHPQQFRLMYVSGLLTDEFPRDPALVEVADAFYDWARSVVADSCVARDAKSVSAAMIALWSVLHGFALMRMGKRFKPFMRGALSDAELADTVVDAAVVMTPAIRVRERAAPRARAPRRIVNQPA